MHPFTVDLLTFQYCNTVAYLLMHPFGPDPEEKEEDKRSIFAHTRSHIVY